MSLSNPRAYHPTFQQDLAIFYHQIFYCPTKHTLLPEINDRYFATCPGLTVKLITKYLPDSEITAKEKLDQQKQRTVVADSTNETPIETKARENTNEIILHQFDPTEKIYSDLTGKFPVQSDRWNNYILVDYRYDIDNILTIPLKI